MRSVPFLMVCLALGSAGCENLRTVKQCKELARRVNPELEAITEGVAKEPNAAGYKKAAARFVAAAKTLDEFDAGLPELDRAVDDYASSLRTSGQHADDLAAALEAGNQESAALATRELSQVKQAQKSAVKRFTQECQGH